MNELQSNKVAKRWKLTSVLLAIILIALVIGGFLSYKNTTDSLKVDNDSLKKQNQELQEKLSQSDVKTPQDTTITTPVKPKTTYTSTHGDSLTVTMPAQKTPVTSPLTVSGTAPGAWFNEGQFNAKLIMADGMTLTTGVMKADDTLDHTKPATFSGVLKWDQQAGGKGFIVLEKDNPSGLPENADSVKVPVVF